MAPGAAYATCTNAAAGRSRCPGHIYVAHVNASASLKLVTKKSKATRPACKRCGETVNMGDPSVCEDGTAFCLLCVDEIQAGAPKHFDADFRASFDPDSFNY